MAEATHPFVRHLSPYSWLRRASVAPRSCLVGILDVLKLLRKSRLRGSMGYGGCDALCLVLVTASAVISQAASRMRTTFSIQGQSIAKNCRTSQQRAIASAIVAE